MNMQAIEKTLLASQAAAMITPNVLVPSLRCGVPLDANVLHIGCGAGRVTQTLARVCPEWGISALDSDTNLAGRAMHRLAGYRGRVQVTRADPPELPYDDKTFDLVIATYVWHRLAEWRAVTAQVRRVLRPAGVLLLADFFIPSVLRRAFTRTPPSYPTLTEIKVALTAAELTITDSQVRSGVWYRFLARR